MNREDVIKDYIEEFGRFPSELEIETELKSRIEVLEAAADDNALLWNGDY